MSEEQGGVVNHGEEAWQDGDLLEKLYHEKGMSTNDIADELGCGATTVLNWMEKNGIDRRDPTDGIRLAYSDSLGVWFRTNPRKGYERIACEKKTVLHHRLLAVAHWGFDALKGNHVHHENHIPWDNRIENLKLVDPSTHSKMHRENKMDWLDRLRAVEMYSEGASSYDLADVFDVTPGTVLNNIRTVDENVVRSNRGAA